VCGTSLVSCFAAFARRFTLFCSAFRRVQIMPSKKTALWPFTH
jgi:hypothetical protein